MKNLFVNVKSINFMYLCSDENRGFHSIVS